MGTEEDELALGVFLDAIERAQAKDRQAVRNIAAAQFHGECIIDQVMAALVEPLPFHALDQFPQPCTKLWWEAVAPTLIDKPYIQQVQQIDLVFQAERGELHALIASGHRRNVTRWSSRLHRATSRFG